MAEYSENYYTNYLRRYLNDRVDNSAPGSIITAVNDRHNPFDIAPLGAVVLAVETNLGAKGSFNMPKREV